MMLDLRTIYVVSAMTCLVLGSVHLAAHRSGRFGRWPAWWGVSNLLIGIGSFCVSLRDFVPSFVSLDAGNVLTIAGYLLTFFAVRVFAERPVGERYCVLAIACISLPVLMFTGDPAAVSARILYVSTVCCLCDLAILREGLTIHRREKLFSAGLLAWLYMPTAAIFLVRSLLAASGRISGPGVFGDNPVHSWMAATALVFLVLRSMVIVLMAAERSRNKLIDLAHRDPLTGALNRGGLAQRLLFRRAQSFALLAIDIDNFKQLNDQHGHVLGDDILRLFARVAQAVLRPGDLLSRQGGDEFLAVLKDMPDAEAVQTAESIRLAFSAAVMQVPGLAVFPTLSIGVAASGETGVDFEQLLRKADEALYASKRRGRNRVEASAKGEQAA
ncbi:GGDEF domain-containing protein [Rhizobium sp. T1470]|uniref:GGDEF domain-containing protein n=1 Tax=unclassified Rhizobium TaxID=2613769 RepID=UPI001AAF387F|nr:GGDEF domain-containing protein [Rhizobium sp. T1473]MCA0803299.1 GGDEF domain-containing protein [Rhizobium sp. T1473]